MLKRFLSLALTLCLLCGPAALAEKRTLRVLHGGVPEAFAAAHPEVKIEEVSYHARTSEWDVFMQTEGLDVALMEPGSIDFETLKKTGVLYDLSGSESIRQAVSRMQPDLQKLATDDEGRIVALPASLMELSFYRLQDAWDAAGLTDSDVPQSYTELLDFLETWMARTAEHPEKSLCVSRLFTYNMTGQEKFDHVNWLMDLLRMCWEYQQRFAGQPVNYDDPAFLALAERTRDVGTALYKSEPRYKKRQKLQELFRSDLSGGPYANDGRDYGVSHALPLRIARDQPKLLSGRTYLWLIRADAPHPQDALALLESGIPSDSLYHYGLYVDMQPGTAAAEHASPITVSQGWLDDWHGYDGTVVFYPYDYTWEYKPMLKFFAGKLSAEELAKSLNEFVTLPWWEQY